MSKILLIDNYDSFTYNIVHLISRVTGIEPDVVTHDCLSWSMLQKNNYSYIVISPGPGHPNNTADFGIAAEIILKAEVPILGICLGHQGICSAFGGQVVHAPQPMHGRVSEVIHQGDQLFNAIPERFNAVRYHSLICQQPLPSMLVPIAWTEGGLVMALRHRTKPIFGVQFHPESIGSSYGEQLFKNFFDDGCLPAKVVNASARLCVQPNHYALKVRKLQSNLSVEAIFSSYTRHKPYPFWLDSSKLDQGEARFSILGSLEGQYSFKVQYDLKVKQCLVETSQGDVTGYNESIFDFLKRQLQQFHIQSADLPFGFKCGFVGYLGYELKQETVQVMNIHQSDYPDAYFIFVDRAIVVDHQNNDCYLLCLNALGDSDALSEQWMNGVEWQINNAAPLEDAKHMDVNADHSEFELVTHKENYIKNINTCLQHIRQGNSYEVCLTNQLTMQGHIDPLAYYLRLRQINPAPYAAYFDFKTFAIASASVERFLKVNASAEVETKPIKGTLPRGKTPDEDKKLYQQLACDEKFQSENLMIVDLLRNDLAKVCQTGSVYVPYLMQVETYQTVHQLVSTVRGTLRPSMTAVDCMKACFPGGSMVGAPKKRTLEIIDALESKARGIYSGSLGYFSLTGEADFNIVIRTAVISHQDVRIGVGGAIIDLSDPDAEYEEILLKGKALIEAAAKEKREVDCVS